MDAEAAQRIGRCIAIQLERGNFEACHNIINDVQAEDREEVEKLISEAETGLTTFTQETYERIQNLEPENGTNSGV